MVEQNRIYFIKYLLTAVRLYLNQVQNNAILFCEIILILRVVHYYLFTQISVSSNGFSIENRIENYFEEAV